MFKRTSTKKTIFTQPLIDGEYKSLPARFVPPEIIRPNFARKTISDIKYEYLIIKFQIKIYCRRSPSYSRTKRKKHYQDRRRNK